MTRRALVVLASAALFGAPAVARAAPNTVSVAAASDLKFALDELLVGLRSRRPDLTVTVSYGSSGTFATQLQQGAPFDLFLSADVAYARDLETKGLVAAGSVFTYAVGRLVLWVPTSSALDLSKLGMTALIDPSVQHVAIANPAHAPYGRAAEAALRGAGVYEAVRAKLVLGENIAQTAQFVQTGAADAGLLALSLALAPPMVASGRYWEVPPDAYPALNQGGCVLKRAQDPDAAATVVAALMSSEGRATLKKYGFSPATAP